MKQNVSPCSLVELILFELLSKVEGTEEGHDKLATQPIPGNNSLPGVFQNKICLLTFKVTFSEEKC